MMDGPNIREFDTYEDMVGFVDSPSALFIKVTDDNWDDLYDQGAFHV